MTRRPIHPRQLAAIMQRQPESLAARMARELSAEAGGPWWLVLLCVASAALGFILGGWLFK